MEIRHFWSQTQKLLDLNETLHFDKFEGADFNYDNSVFKFQTENPQERQFRPEI